MDKYQEEFMFALGQTKQPVDVIGAEEMLQGMVNGANAVTGGTRTAAADLDVGSVVETAVGTGGHVQTAAEAWGDLIQHPVKNATDFWDWLDLDLGSWFDGLDMQHWLAPLTGMVHFASGGLLTWLMAIFVGLRIVSAGKSMVAGPRTSAPGRTQFYLVPKGTADPIVKFLGSTYPHLDQYLVKQPGGEDTEMVGAPAWGQGDAERGLNALKSKTGLTYRKVN